MTGVNPSPSDGVEGSHSAPPPDELLDGENSAGSVYTLAALDRLDTSNDALFFSEGQHRMEPNFTQPDDDLISLEED